MTMEVNNSEAQQVPEMTRFPSLPSPIYENAKDCQDTLKTTKMPASPAVPPGFQFCEPSPVSVGFR